MKNDEARALAQKMLDFNFHHALWFKKQLDRVMLFNDDTINITAAKLRILMAISAFDLNTLPALSCFLLTSKSSLSITITKMVKEGYLRKEMPAIGEDGRKIYFHITALGIELLHSIEKKSISALSEFCRELDDSEAKQLETGLHQLSQIYK